MRKVLKLLALTACSAALCGTMARKFERSRRRGWPGSKEQDYGKEE